ncbi:MAG TPA: protein kinase [Pilimelia sp.]|nr:protein kinase [Pilimelia sp.]
MFSPGVVLGGRYRLDERIAGGGMGDVWRGTDDVLGRTVGVKILLPALLDEPGFAERFRGEARTIAAINHAGVVDIYDYGSDDQVAYLVMEFVEGDALSRTLARVRRLTPARTMSLVAQAAEALHAAHLKGIIHRDVKPGNLLVRPDGTLVLTDFGIARSEMVGQLTAAGAVLGTASYIAPEQATGGVATPASDVYSLGIVAYQCLAGRRPFEGDNPIEIAMKHAQEAAPALPGDIPAGVRAIVERAMAKTPEDRWPSAAAFAGVARQAALAVAGPPPGHPATGAVRPPARGTATPTTGPYPPSPRPGGSSARGQAAPGALSGQATPGPARGNAGPGSGTAAPARPTPGPYPPPATGPADPPRYTPPGEPPSYPPPAPTLRQPDDDSGDRGVTPAAPARVNSAPADHGDSSPARGYPAASPPTPYRPPVPAAHRAPAGTAPPRYGYPTNAAPARGGRWLRRAMIVALVATLLALLVCVGVITYLLPQSRSSYGQETAGQGIVGTYELSEGRSRT